MAATTTAIVVGTLIAASAASTAYQISESEKAKKAAKAEATRQKDEFTRQQDELKTKEANDRSEKARLAGVTASRQRALLSTPGQRSTILTSSLGVPGQPQAARKTLLGA